MNKNLYLNNSEKDWLLRIRSILNKTKKNQIILPPNDEIWYTSSDGNIVRPASGVETDPETGDMIYVYDGPYNNIFGADIISNTYENGKGIIKFDGDVTKLEPGEDFMEYGYSMFNEGIDPWGSRSPRLTSINLPGSVTSIGNSAFKYCTGLTSINIPGSVTSIGNSTFESCWGLTSITIPSSVTSIGDYAFSSCTGLTTLTIPGSVTSIGQAAFSDCIGLTSITIPNSVTSIGEFAFYGVKNVAYTGSATGSPWGANCVNGYVEGDFIFSDNTKTTLVSYIGENESVVIPEGVINITSDIFFYMVKQMGFRITSITIPASVTSIGNGAFAELLDVIVTSLNTTPPTIGSRTFDSEAFSGIIYVPASSVDAYKAASNWSNIANHIQAIQEV